MSTKMDFNNEILFRFRHYKKTDAPINANGMKINAVPVPFRK
jgi:hypothetical protein